MEMEPSPPIIAKKMWNIVKVVFYMLRKGILKSKLMVELHTFIKRGKLAGKAISNLMLHHHSALSCRSNDVHLSFFSPREYEFSCSNSPIFSSYYTRRKNHHNHHHQNYNNDVKVIQKVFDMLNSEIPEASPLAALPGFGKTPTVRQLRITDSPFPLRDTDQEDTDQVNKAAEEFIKKFYKELKQQKIIAALESPSPYHMWGR